MTDPTQNPPPFNPARIVSAVVGVIMLAVFFGAHVKRGHGEISAMFVAFAVVWVMASLLAPLNRSSAWTTPTRSALHAVTDQGIQVRVSRFPTQTVFVPWSTVERAALVHSIHPGNQNQVQSVDMRDVALWLREPVGPFSADPTVVEPHIRLQPWLDGMGPEQLYREVQQRLDGGAPGSLSVRAEAHYLPHGGSDLFELHLYPDAPGYLSRFRTYEHEQSQEVERDLSPGESIRIQQDLADRDAFSLPSVDDPYKDGVRGQIVLQRGAEKHTIELHSVAEDNPSRALLTYLLELTPLPARDGQGVL